MAGADSTEKEFKKFDSLFDGDIALAEDKEFFVNYGSLNLHVTRSPGEYLLGWKYTGEIKPLAFRSRNPNRPEGVESFRWITQGSEEAFRLQPALPEKSCIFKSQVPIKVPPRVSCQFYVLIPIFLQVTRPEPGKALMFEKPAFPLSQAWFGEMPRGELGYHLDASFYMEMHSHESKYYQAFCPVQLRNASSEDLNFQRLSIQAQHLTLFKGSRNLWTNKIQVTYEDASESETKIQASPEQEGEDIKQIAAPRKPAEGNIFKNTFDRIRKINV